MSSTLSLPPTPFPQSLTLSLALLILSESSAFYLGSALFKTLSSLSFFLGGLDIGGFIIYQLPFDWTTIRYEERYRYTLFMILGLGFSVLGDVFLIPSRDTYYSFRRPLPGSKQTTTPVKGEGDSLWFKAGIFFFALAQISYTVAFASNPSRIPFRWTAFGLASVVVLGVSKWLGILGGSSPSSPTQLEIPNDMAGLVSVYVCIITTMVGTATATDPSQQKILGAWMFVISDLFVAVDVFGKKKLPPAYPRSYSGRNKRSSGSRPGWAFRSVGWIFYFGANLVLAGSI
ncbi:hypothetical protein H1R20_g16540, partial [Candolleomyces eurysporus]